MLIISLMVRLCSPRVSSNISNNYFLRFDGLDYHTENFTSEITKAPKGAFWVDFLGEKE